MKVWTLDKHSPRLPAYWMKHEWREGDLGPATHSSHAKVQSHECARIRVHFTALVMAHCQLNKKSAELSNVQESKSFSLFPLAV